MAFEHFRVHPERPPIRIIQRAANVIQQGGFVVIPTETTYAIVMDCSAFTAQHQVQKMRHFDECHLWSLMCMDLSQAAQFVKIDNQNHRILKRYLPGPYTFILPANSKVPRRVLSKRKEIGIRISDTEICRMLLQQHGQPLLVTTMQLPDEPSAVGDPASIVSHINHFNSALIDAGWGGQEPTTVVNLIEPQSALIRQGAGVWQD